MVNQKKKNKISKKAGLVGISISVIIAIAILAAVGLALYFIVFQQ